MLPTDELANAAQLLTAAAELGEAPGISEPIQALRIAAEEVGRAFSGSWLGYHSRVYYEGLLPPPPGANFSQEWGLQGHRYLSLGSRGDWREYDPDDVKREIQSIAKQPDLQSARDAARSAESAFEKSKAEAISILDVELADRPDSFLQKIRAELEKLKTMSAANFARAWSPGGTIMTRDTLALGQGNKVPPHLEILAEVASITWAFGICRTAAESCLKAASHLERKNRRRAASARVGTNVFIGHGRALMWRELKDFIQDRLGLPWDEFNRVPVAGITNIARLAEMLDAAALALLVMTAEDELTDGGVQARMNVVHEAGLFQGRLGFTKAIVLLEEGCREFSNIQGLGQIRFAKGQISTAFEEVRRVLEREGVVRED